MPEECPHGNATITGGGPYYRQVHPNNFQDGRVLSPAFVLHDTGCHLERVDKLAGSSHLVNQPSM